MPNFANFHTVLWGNWFIWFFPHCVVSFQNFPWSDFYVPPCSLQVPTWHFLICWGIAVYQCPHFRRLFSPKRKEFRTFPRETCLQNEKSILKSFQMAELTTYSALNSPQKYFQKGCLELRHCISKFNTKILPLIRNRPGITRSMTLITDSQSSFFLNAWDNISSLLGWSRPYN